MNLSRISNFSKLFARLFKIAPKTTGTTVTFKFLKLSLQLLETIHSRIFNFSKLFVRLLEIAPSTPRMTGTTFTFKFQLITSVF